MTLTVAELEALLGQTQGDTPWELARDLRARYQAEQEDDYEFHRRASEQPKPEVAW